MNKPIAVSVIAIAIFWSGCGGTATETVTVTTESAAKSSHLTSDQVGEMQAGASKMATALDAYATATGACVDLADLETIDEFAKCPRVAADALQPTLAETVSAVTEMTKGLTADKCQSSLVDYGLSLADLHEAVGLVASRSEARDFDGASSASGDVAKLMEVTPTNLGTALTDCIG